MRAASTTLIAFLNAARVNPDMPIAFADCFTFTLLSGAAIYLTNVDYPIVYNGNTFSCAGPQVQGMKYSTKVGLEVDRQQIAVAARPSDLVSGAAFLTMIADGALDGASVERDRVFMSAPGGAVVGGVTLFKGRVSTVDQVDRLRAQLTIASDLVILDQDMPRNLYSPTCVHALYDSGCALSAASFATSSTAGAGSTAQTILTSAALAAHAQGRITFTSGANAGVSATVKSAVAGTSLTLLYPLPEPVATGDAFTVYDGCDHTQATCNARFSNLANFRAFPYVPPPQLAYGITFVAIPFVLWLLECLSRLPGSSI